MADEQAQPEIQEGQIIGANIVFGSIVPQQFVSNGETVHYLEGVMIVGASAFTVTFDKSLRDVVKPMRVYPAVVLEPRSVRVQGGGSEVRFKVLAIR